MHMKTLLILFLIACSELCLSIKVPAVWEGNTREVHEPNSHRHEDQKKRYVQSLDDPNTHEQKQLPVEYFQYPAKKPQFAVDVAIFHGDQSPQNHYKAYPIKPYTGVEKPQLGKHQLFDENRNIYQPYEKLVKRKEISNNNLSPISTNYEIFHPYKAEEPALQRLYKDPALSKVKNDLRNAKIRLQNYEKEAEQPHITQDEYLENPDQIDRKKIPHKNVPTEFEIHKPLRRPTYYTASPKLNNRERILNNKFKHPWNQNFIKVRPVHYQPLKTHLQKLRDHHSAKYDDEHNEYPQILSPEKHSHPPDGYDIYENGKNKYTQLRDNVDESLTKIARENRPNVYQKLELQGDQSEKEQENVDESDEEYDDNEFVPVKNYAQVRKIETTKHLPKSAAYEDAETYEEILNAPRLREAIKSKKAQTVYTEEGYEDAAYDHAGEQKHASDHERHGGLLRQKEVSGGKYKIPSINSAYEDNDESGYGEQVLHRENWKDNKLNNEAKNESEDYSEEEEQDITGSDIYPDDSEDSDNRRNKRENIQDELHPQQEVDRQKANFKVPEIDISSTYLNEDEILKISKMKLEPVKVNFEEKYPYYYKNQGLINKDSPLRYAENLNLIPRKSKGGTEFYDSRSKYQCAEVEDDVDPIPEKLKKGDHPDEVENQSDNVNKPRLKGLGDKIDCFKAKYFGENPLDSPFFKEDIILSPEPVTPPDTAVYKLSKRNNSIQDTVNKTEQDVSASMYHNYKIFDILEKLRNDHKTIRKNLEKANEDLALSFKPPLNETDLNITKLTHQSSVYNDVLQNINNRSQELMSSHKNKTMDSDPKDQIVLPSVSNITYNHFYNKEDIVKLTPLSRKKRTTPFTYEPYKIIRDGQIPDTKKTSAKSNISPLIRKLQSIKVIETATKPQENTDQTNKRNVDMLTYKNIGRNERKQSSNAPKDETSITSFVNVNVDKRRGEPRYELKHSNHKSEYTPIESTKSKSLKEKHVINEKKPEQMIDKQDQVHEYEPTVRPFFDVSEYLPKSVETQKPSASETVSRVVRSTTSMPKQDKKLLQDASKMQKTKHSEITNENYNEYDDDEDEEEIATTTTTPKPTFKKRSKSNNTEGQLQTKGETKPQKLQLVTRFNPSSEEENAETSVVNHNQDNVSIPKYREKKKKSSMSTLVTDTKRYVDGEDDTRKEEVDDLIGIKHDMDEYMPSYEKEQRSKQSKLTESGDDHEGYEISDEDEDIEEENDDDDEEDSYGEELEESETPLTTPLPSKRTLPRTTEAPVSTTESRNAKLEQKPVVIKKKIKIHKELPANSSAPHVTQYKQDIKEIEIVKEIPDKSSTQSSNKNLEVLDLYKDDNLAKDINKLRDVEIFKEDLDIVNGPKHGGNYRSADIKELKNEADLSKSRHGGNLKAPPNYDVEASQSENTRQVELSHNLTPRRMHGGNLKSINDYQRTRNNRERNAKLTELSDTNKSKPMHGGNLKLNHSRGRTRGGSRSEKYTELDDSNNDDDDHSTSTQMHGGNLKPFGSSRSNRPLHGGNYRSAKIVQSENNEDGKAQNTGSGSINFDQSTSKDARSSAAALLNGFAQAAPLLTTTPAYILDPSKRMYYYVD